MTHKQWVKMSKARRQIKVARLAGWYGIHSLDVYGRTVWYGWHDTLHPKKKYSYETMLPDYLDDLNETHIIEKLIPYEKMFKYVLWLARLTGPNGVYCLATAAQRAEAFVLTMEPEVE